MAARSRAPRVLLLGLPYFGRTLAEGLRGRGWRARYARHPGRSPRGWLRIARAVAQSDIVYLVGGRAERRTPANVLLHLRRRALVMHWEGTDALLAVEAARRGEVSPRIVEGAMHWCDAPWFVEELAETGIAAEYVPLPVPGLAASVEPLPERFRVLLYLPVDAFDREVFDAETILRLPHELPEIEFVLIPSPAESLPGELPANLEARGWTDDTDALYGEISVYVRLTTHDGISFMALEALSRGRYVIWTHPQEGAILARTLDEVTSALRELAQRHAAGRLGANDEGARLVRERFDYDSLLAALDGRLRELVESTPG